MVQVPERKQEVVTVKILFVGPSDEHARSIAEAYDGKVKQSSYMQVGWLTVPLGHGFETSVSCEFDHKSLLMYVCCIQKHTLETEDEEEGMDDEVAEEAADEEEEQG